MKLPAPDLNMLADEKIMEEEAFREDTEFYVQKYMVLLLCKMLNQSVIELDSTLSEQLVSFLKGLLQSPDKEQLEGALSILSVLFQSQKLLTFIGKQNILIQLFMSLDSHSHSQIKKKFLSCLSNVFFQSQEDMQKDSRMLANIFFSYKGSRRWVVAR